MRKVKQDDLMSDQVVTLDQMIREGVYKEIKFELRS